VPFFANRAATLTAASRFAGFNASPVVLVRQHRDTQHKRYTLEFTSLTPPLPSGDNVFDASTINAALESAIRKEPSQYLWMHKRFKTQPGGKPESPYIHIKTPDKKLSEAQYAGMLGGATQHAATGFTQLTSGLVLREFAGVPGKLLKHRHAALRLDRLSKNLRANGIRTATVDNLFRIKTRGVTAVTCFVPAGLPLQPGAVSVLDSVTFLAQLHNRGFHLAHVAQAGLRILVGTDGRPVLADPLQVKQVPGSVSYECRLDDLRTWARLTQGGATTLPVLLENYLPLVRHADAAGFRDWLAQQPRVADNAPQHSGEP